MKSVKVLSTIALIGLTLGCDTKSRVRQPHESAKDWQVKAQSAEVISASSADFNKINLEQLESQTVKGGQQQLTEAVNTLSPFVYNGSYLAQPSHRSRRLEKAIEIANRSLFTLLKADSALKKEERQSFLNKFENALFYGCQADLKRGCLNADILGGNTFTARILTISAVQDDGELELLIRNAKSVTKCLQENDRCRFLTQLRYRRLAMAFTIRRGDGPDQDMAFAFMKHIRALSELIQNGSEVGYLTNTYSSIFETLIAKFKPSADSKTDFKDFIESFNPWAYSNKSGQVFRHGTKKLFELAAACCLYKDGARTQISESMVKAISESQTEVDSEAASVYNLVLSLSARKTNSRQDVLTNLGLGPDLASLRDLNSSFYNEHLYIVDRLFKGHIDSAEAMRILERTNPARIQRQLLPAVRAYLRIQLAALTMDTIDFMNRLYNSNTISSDMIFSEAIMVSRDLSIRWQRTQTRLDLLDSFIGSYYNRMPVLPADFIQTTRLMKSINRNVHYLSVYPNMIGISYFLAKNQGAIEARSWWGDTFKIDPTTVVTALFEGQFATPWFKFSTDPVLLSKERLFYAFYYALKTQALDIFTVQEKDSQQSDRSKFLELTLGKYLESDKRNLDDVLQKVDNEIIRHPLFDDFVQICRYETDSSGQVTPQTVELDFFALGQHSYSGFGGGDTITSIARKLLTGDLIDTITGRLDQLESKLTFARSVISIVEQHMLETGEISSLEAANKELEKVRKIVVDIEEGQQKLQQVYLKFYKPAFTCAQRLYEVELHRAYRMYLEEREHLGRVYDELSAARKAGGSTEALKQANARLFPNQQYRFDTITTDSYRLSQFDFYMRTARRLEGDIFLKPSARELQIFGQKVTNLSKPRPIRVVIPPGIEQMDIVKQGTSQYSKLISYVDDKEMFIREGLKAFDGHPGSFAEWFKQANQIAFFKEHTSNLIKLYLMGQLQSQQGSIQIAGQEITDAFRDTLRLFDLNDLDTEIALVLGMDGRATKESLEGFVLEPTSLNSQPILRWVMDQTYNLAGMGNNVKGILKSGLDLTDMLGSEGVVIFDPGASLEKVLMTEYKKPIQRLISRTHDLYQYVSQFEQDPTWRALLKTRVRVEGGRALSIEDHPGQERATIVDRRMIENLRINTSNYHMRTDKKFLATGGK